MQKVRDEGPNIMTYGSIPVPGESRRTEAHAFKHLRTANIARNPDEFVNLLSPSYIGGPVCLNRTAL
jgi:hypothetical protein